MCRMCSPIEDKEIGVFSDWRTGKLMVTNAPQSAVILLASLQWADPEMLQFDGDRLTICNQVVYRITGFKDGYLTAELIEDWRDKPRKSAVVSDEQLEG